MADECLTPELCYLARKIIHRIELSKSTTAVAIPTQRTNAPPVVCVRWEPNEALRSEWTLPVETRLLEPAIAMMKQQADVQPVLIARHG
jgi:hypothetical protein